MVNTADAAWVHAFRNVLIRGSEVSPRGKKVRELEHHTVMVDMRYPVVLARPEMNRRFMAAEALWMLQGRDDVEMLAQHVPRMNDFSDDGRSLAGAYGPRIAEQLNYVVNKLREDRDTRQAALTIWRPNPMPSRDIPCTLAMTFQIRDNQLNAHVFMRSSDVWLGLPYDVFSFTMVAEWVRMHYNFVHGIAGNGLVAPGMLYVTAASSHLYEEHWGRTVHARPVTPPMPNWNSPEHLLSVLDVITGSTVGSALRWWER